MRLTQRHSGSKCASNGDGSIHSPSVPAVNIGYMMALCTFISGAFAPLKGGKWYCKQAFGAVRAEQLQQEQRAIAELHNINHRRLAQRSAQFSFAMPHSADAGPQARSLACHMPAPALTSQHMV